MSLSVRVSSPTSRPAAGGRRRRGVAGALDVAGGQREAPQRRQAAARERRGGRGADRGGEQRAQEDERAHALGGALDLPRGGRPRRPRRRRPGRPRRAAGRRRAAAARPSARRRRSRCGPGRSPGRTSAPAGSRRPPSVAERATMRPRASSTSTSRSCPPEGASRAPGAVSSAGADTLRRATVVGPLAQPAVLRGAQLVADDLLRRRSPARRRRGTRRPRRPGRPAAAASGPSWLQDEADAAHGPDQLRARRACGAGR